MAQVEHIHLVCPAETRNRLHQRVEHGLEVNGRTADDLQHLRGRGLLVKRLGEVVGALTQLIEQPCVLDGDDGLVGEGRTFSIAITA
jgi:hypothetical protein